MAEEIELCNVPDDFPQQEILGSISGAAPKLLLVRTASGGYAAPTQSAKERRQRWQKCEVLAGKVARAAARSKAAQCAHMSEESILALYFQKMQTSFHARHDESLWIVQKAALILGWPFPRLT